MTWFTMGDVSYGYGIAGGFALGVMIQLWDGTLAMALLPFFIAMALVMDAEQRGVFE